MFFFVGRKASFLSSLIPPPLPSYSYDGVQSKKGNIQYYDGVTYNDPTLVSLFHHYSEDDDTTKSDQKLTWKLPRHSMPWKRKWHIRTDPHLSNETTEFLTNMCNTYYTWKIILKNFIMPKEKKYDTKKMVQLVWKEHFGNLCHKAIQLFVTNYRNKWTIEEYEHKFVKLQLRYDTYKNEMKTIKSNPCRFNI